MEVGGQKPSFERKHGWKKRGEKEMKIEITENERHILGKCLGFYYSYNQDKKVKIIIKDLLDKISRNVKIKGGK